MAEWIACSERLPTCGMFVMFASEGVALRVGFGIRGGVDKDSPWFAWGGPQLAAEEVTHWQPMPQPPAQPQRGEGAG